MKQYTLLLAALFFLVGCSSSIEPKIIKTSEISALLMDEDIKVAYIKEHGKKDLMKNMGA